MPCFYTLVLKKTTVFFVTLHSFVAFPTNLQNNLKNQKIKNWRKTCCFKLYLNLKFI